MGKSPDLTRIDDGEWESELARADLEPDGGLEAGRSTIIRARAGCDSLGPAIDS
jgi:hypothetical protein